MLSFALQNALDLKKCHWDNWEDESKDASQDTCLIQKAMLNFRDRSFHTFLYAQRSRSILFE
tara:strand:+ start:1644 stop:1829 length:186 start_codon:yes stop_codon:yes gene_type:complete